MAEDERRKAGLGGCQSYTLNELYCRFDVLFASHYSRLANSFSLDGPLNCIVSLFGLNDHFMGGPVHRQIPEE